MGSEVFKSLIPLVQEQVVRLVKGLVIVKGPWIEYWYFLFAVALNI